VLIPSVAKEWHFIPSHAPRSIFITLTNMLTYPTLAYPGVSVIIELHSYYNFYRSGMSREEEMRQALAEFERLVRANKPEDRSELSRKYAVLLTDVEKLRAYFMQFIFTKEIV
jgi:hypothetical protein